MATYWSKQPDKIPLYSDWKVQFTKCGAPTKEGKNNDDADTASLSSSDGEHSIDPGSPARGGEEDESNNNIVSSSPPLKEEKEVSFAVHRNMIGPRSQYFTNSFTSKALSNATSSVINLPSNLPRKAFAALSEAFEVLLDYCYSSTATEFDFSKSKLTTDNAVAMYCLCNYFQMDEDVCIKVREFITNDLTEETVTTYYRSVKDLRMDKSDVDNEDAFLNVGPIHDMIAYLCYKFPNVLSVDIDDDSNSGDDGGHSNNNKLPKIADLPMWLSIGTLLSDGGPIHFDEGSSTDYSSENSTSVIEVDSKVWSENLTHFFDHCHDDDLKESFHVLTSSKVLPVISEKVALRLLEHERLFGLGDGPSDQSLAVGGSKSIDTLEEESSSDIANDNEDLDRVIEVGSSDDEDEDNSQRLRSSRKTTSLQRRCIKSLADSNWFGEENDLEKIRGTGKLSETTSTYVLEELLIESVTGERKLGSKVRVLKEEIEIEKQLRREELEKNQMHITRLKVDLVKEQSKQQRLTEVLEDEAKKRDDAEQKLISFDMKLEEEKKKLRKENEKLQAKLEEEKKRSFNLDLRYRTLKSARGKMETDREMLELTCKETITRLEAMSSQEEWWNNACGVMTPLILMLSTMSDRRECDKIKEMLQQVVEDPSSYERNFLLKNVDEDGEDVTVVLTSTLETKGEDGITINSGGSRHTCDTLDDDYHDDEVSKDDF